MARAFFADGPDPHMNLINSVRQLVVLATTKTTTASTKSSTGSSSFLIVLVLIMVVLYFALVRPSQRRRMAVMRQNRSYDVGDEVIAGGMVGKVVRIGDNEVDIAAGDGIFTFVPQAVQSRSAFNAAATRGSGGAGVRNAQRAQDEGAPPEAEGYDADADGTGAPGVADGEPEEGQWPEGPSAWGFNDGQDKESEA